MKSQDGQAQLRRTAFRWIKAYALLNHVSERPRQPLPVMLASLACPPRRLACRYWAGRVALRENCARHSRNQAAVGQAALRCSLYPGMRLHAPGAALLGQHARGVVSFLDCMNDPQPEGHMAGHIERRKLSTLLGGVATARPLAAA